jgi:hypothetical protein
LSLFLLPGGEGWDTIRPRALAVDVEDLVRQRMPDSADRTAVDQRMDVAQFALDRVRQCEGIQTGRRIVGRHGE